MKTISSLLAATAVVSMFWIQVKPDGAQFCKSGGQFRPWFESQSNIKAAELATSLFCDVVKSNPM